VRTRCQVNKGDAKASSHRDTVGGAGPRIVMTVSSENLIGEYLRARRELVLPEDVGLPKPDPRRRVPGLRRAEVAMLAGVSPEYYMRLEQGRDQHPSPQVLDALARALRLDEDATAYLRRLAQPGTRRRSRRPRPERVPATIAGLIDSWDTTPAYVQGRYLDVLAVNALAAALAPFYAVGTNLLRAAFLDPRVQDMHPGWEHTTESLVAGLRATIGPDTDDLHLNELIGELSVRSDRFRSLWARHDARPKPPGPTLMDHPQLGRLELHYHRFPIPASEGQEIVIYHAEPGSRTAQSLALLASLNAGQPTRTEARDDFAGAPSQTTDEARDR
jgi:transcriptional regulator with XRE-family HTH domain